MFGPAGVGGAGSVGIEGLLNTLLGGAAGGKSPGSAQANKTELPSLDSLGLNPIGFKKKLKNIKNSRDATVLLNHLNGLLEKHRASAQTVLSAYAEAVKRGEKPDPKPVAGLMSDLVKTFDQLSTPEGVNRYINAQIRLINWRRRQAKEPPIIIPSDVKSKFCDAIFEEMKSRRTRIAAGAAEMAANLQKEPGFDKDGWLGRFTGKIEEAFKTGQFKGLIADMATNWVTMTGYSAGFAFIKSVFDWYYTSAKGVLDRGTQLVKDVAQAGSGKG